jgi:hypothetical protein
MLIIPISCIIPCPLLCGKVQPGNTDHQAQPGSRERQSVASLSARWYRRRPSENFKARTHVLVCRQWAAALQPQPRLDSLRSLSDLQVTRTAGIFAPCLRLLTDSLGHLKRIAPGTCQRPRRSNTIAKGCQFRKPLAFCLRRLCSPRLLTAHWKHGPRAHTPPCSGQCSRKSFC